MRTPIFHVDAFATRCFAGNPAAVMPIDSFPSDDLLQEIAAENNLSETAFLVRPAMIMISGGSRQQLKCPFAVMPRWPALQ